MKSIAFLIGFIFVSIDCFLFTWEESSEDAGDVCDVHNRRRVECTGAYPGITQRACDDLGCCYDSTVINKPWCFPPNTDAVYEECDVEPSRRIHCPGAYRGILHAACQDLGCCYDNSNPSHPWCFPKKTADDYTRCAVKPTERELCSGAYPGITPYLCGLLHCCHDHNILRAIAGIPSCFSYRDSGSSET